MFACLITDVSFGLFRSLWFEFHRKTWKHIHFLELRSWNLNQLESSHYSCPIGPYQSCYGNPGHGHINLLLLLFWICSMMSVLMKHGDVPVKAQESTLVHSSLIKRARLLLPVAAWMSHAPFPTEPCLLCVIFAFDHPGELVSRYILPRCGRRSSKSHTQRESISIQPWH